MFEQRDFNFIYKYFIAEKQESLLFIIIGIVAVLLAITCWFFIKSNPFFYKGLAVPLMVLGIVQLVVGFTVHQRSDKQKATIAYNIGIEPTTYVKNTELPRMEKVMKNFIVYRWIEIACIIIGLTLVFLFKANPYKAFWFGLGLALTVQAAIMLGADYFAEKRGEIYTESLKQVLK